MVMSYGQYMSQEDKAHDKMIEAERIEMALELCLSELGYDSNDVASMIKDIAGVLIEDKKLGFKPMTLAQLSDSYWKSVS